MIRVAPLLLPLDPNIRYVAVNQAGTITETEQRALTHNPPRPDGGGAHRPATDSLPLDAREVGLLSRLALVEPPGGAKARNAMTLSAVASVRRGHGGRQAPTSEGDAVNTFASRITSGALWFGVWCLGDAEGIGYEEDSSCGSGGAAALSGGGSRRPRAWRWQLARRRLPRRRLARWRFARWRLARWRFARRRLARWRLARRRLASRRSARGTRSSDLRGSLLGRLGMVEPR
jgi:hypothetical protein